MTRHHSRFAMNSLRSPLVLAGVAFVAAAFATSPASAQIAKNAVRQKVAGIDVISYRTGVKDVVTLRGSFPAGTIHAADGQPAVAQLTGALLDKGTTKQDKFAIAQKLEAIGASLNFSAGPITTNVSGKCLKKDLPLVVSLLAEQLRLPAFSAEEFEKAKKQIEGSYKRQLEDTDYRASSAFSRAVYPVGHPARQPSPEEFLAGLAQATLADVKAFHAKHYGPSHFTLVAVGDLDPAQVSAEVGKAFAGWSGGSPVPPRPRTGSVDAAREQTVVIPDKTSVSVVLGHASGLRYSDPDYQALRTGTAILGIGFTGRLMGTVRDQEGLTYGIYAALTNDTFGDGDWFIGASFAPDMLTKGLASTRRELTKWVKDGVTADELERRKGDLTGSFKVALTTTEGMADALLRAVQRGLPLSWLDDYPKVINALTTAQVNTAIKKHLDPGKMVTVLAGTLPAGK